MAQAPTTAGTTDPAASKTPPGYSIMASARTKQILKLVATVRDTTTVALLEEMSEQLMPIIRKHYREFKLPEPTYIKTKGN